MAQRVLLRQRLRCARRSKAQESWFESHGMTSPYATHRAKAISEWGAARHERQAAVRRGRAGVQRDGAILADDSIARVEKGHPASTCDSHDICTVPW
eukprot:6269696-Prymnesium_polylepis.1